jgi:hypothetical protein
MFSDNKNLYDFTNCFDGIIVTSPRGLSRIEILGTHELRNVSIYDLCINEKYMIRCNGTRINLYSKNLCVYADLRNAIYVNRDLVECRITLKKMYNDRYMMKINV